MIRAFGLTAAAMLAFAGNSILCRLALRDGAIDPATFTNIRLVSGALALLLIFVVSRRKFAVPREGSRKAAMMLFAYAICFSYAYTSLDAAAGALILFGFVQATMIAAALIAGERPSRAEWLGWLLAVAGLTWLLLPGSEAPPLAGAALMAASGVAWGFYSIDGRGQSDALASTAANFLRALLPVPIVAWLALANVAITPAGLLLAIVSGAVTSGVGYVIWYAALRHLRSIQAALVQLSVPALAAAGGVLLLDESLTGRLLLAGFLILGGISLSVLGKTGRMA